MLYDTSIEETRCMKTSEMFFKEPRCMKESVRDMLDRLYIVAYLFKMKFRHPVAKASC
ncbi:hypothetical protein SDC9_178682 [bioreactor metagenome]|uniref:Uncharacterized protein n=1 Tax=bioreactor metagenome TaxID=1076179 RepID=A0A645GWV4_9ZZZZ